MLCHKGRKLFYWFLLCIAVLFLHPHRTYARDEDLKDLAGSGITLLKDGDTTGAVQAFSQLLNKSDLLDDFALLWRAQAYFQAGDCEKALADIAVIKGKYTDTAAYPDALRLEMEIARQRDPSGDGILRLYDTYLSLYPDDRGARLDYGKILQAHGMLNQASVVFKQLYIDGDDFSDEASAGFDHSELTPDEIMKRGENLLKLLKFPDAEEMFVAAYGKVPCEAEPDLNEKVAYCEFRQKHYGTAAQLYGYLNDKYMEAVSLLRLGDMPGFSSAVDMLKEMKDPRTGILMFSLASEKRRAGLNEEAIALLKEALADSPFREDALWGIGWTQYMAGLYPAAVETFKRLNEKYPSSKYLYWMLRSGERQAAVSPSDYLKACSEKDYYGFLSCVRAGAEFTKVTGRPEITNEDSPLLRRYYILRALDYRDEAIFELKRIVRNLRKPDDIISFSSKLRDAGDYKSAISVATLLPYKEETHNLLYPSAYWDTVQDAAARFGINPLFILSIAREESRFDPEAKSVAGAVGLMQLMPETARRICGKINYKFQDKEDFFDVQANIVLGSYYLKTLLDRFGSLPLAIAAYNAGESTVQKWISQNRYKGFDEFVEDISYPETRNYVKRVMTTFFQYIRLFPDTDFKPLLKDFSTVPVSGTK